MDVRTLKEYETLSPFEIKDFLIKAALNTSKAASITYLNAGRGNPNWIATEPREAFFLLGQFAITESKRVLDLPAGVGGMPKAQGIADRLEGWLRGHRDSPGARFLEKMVPWTVKQFGFEPDKFVHELLDPTIKAFFVVNPGNPSAMALNDETIQKIGGILKKRPNLILLTDDVYGTFVPGFRSLLGAYPRNTIGVYSYSKYFGCTGWRL